MSPRERASKPDPTAPDEPGAAPETPSPGTEPAAFTASQPEEGRREGGSGGLEEARRAYAEALQSAYDEVRRSSVHAWGEYLHRLQDAQIEAEKRTLSAYRSYLKAASEAVGSENAAETLLDEQTRYYRELEAAWGPEGLQQRYEEACRDYQRALEDADRGLRQGLERAYRSYLRALRDAWAGMDPDAMDPAAMTSVGYGLLAAAQLGWSVSAQRS